MKIAHVKLRSISPYSQGRHYVTPERRDRESAADYEKRTWRERLHITNIKVFNPGTKDEREDGNVFIPPMALKNCLSDTAKFLSMQVQGKGKATYTKHFEAGVLVLEGITLPIKKSEVSGQWLFVPSDGRRGGSSRVDKCFPVIHEWEGVARFHVLDETITPEVFTKHITEAGKFIGLGFFRPRNNGYWGRFTVEDVTWEDVA